MGSRFRIASKMTADVPPENTGRPVAISYSTMPKLKRSARASTSPFTKAAHRLSSARAAQNK